MNLGLFHVHLRGRAKKLIPRPAPTPLVRGFDYIMYGVAICAPFAAVPQLYGIFSTHQVDGLVLTSWLLMTLINLFWIVYGFVHRASPVWINASLWFLLNGAVAVGILLYK